MKAVRFEQGKVVVVDADPPQGVGVRVKIASAGICGSDLHMLAGGYPVPVTVGHEMAGTADDGTPVAIEPTAPCGHCAACVRGQYNLCEAGPQVIYGVGRDGGMAEQLIVPDRCLVPLPAGLPVENACLIEPVAVAVHGLHLARLSAADRVVVVGGGSLGLCAVAAAKVVANDVCLVARHDAQKMAGERLGARLHCDGGFDLAIDCAGTSESMAQTAQLCKPGARILMLATYWQGLTLPAFEVSMKELRMVNATTYCRHGMARDVDVAAALMARNPRIADCIITHRLPLAAAAEAFTIAGNRAHGAIKVVLTP
ncbi:MAG: alcohol dehydrogenase catalytic domain-containing protein [Candidatus Binatia bacterium]